MTNTQRKHCNIVNDDHLMVKVDAVSLNNRYNIFFFFFHENTIVVQMYSFVVSMI